MKNLNMLLRTLVLGTAVVLAGWWTIFLHGKLNSHEIELQNREKTIGELEGRVAQRDEKITLLSNTVEDQELEIQLLGEELQAAEAALTLLKIDHRLARIEVVDQGASEDDPEQMRTTVRFTELGPDGKPLGEGRDITVDGKLIYVETLVIKFEDDFVEQGDSLRGTSICLFKRLFGEEQRPTDGAELDAAGTQPLAYAEDESPDPLHDDLWQSFWDYANDPEAAAARGVRAIHGEAPFIEARPGKTYTLELRASGGVSIRPED